MEVTKDQVYSALATVIDPELGIDIVSLGLIYDVSIKKNTVKIRMTLTSPGCPLAPVIDDMIGEKVGGLAGVGHVETQLVWDPPWTPAMMDAESRAEFGMD